MCIRDSYWVLSMTFLAFVFRTDVRAPEIAEALHRRLRPHAAEAIALGNGRACVGAVAWGLGALDAALERWDAAERHYDAAIRLHRAMEPDRGVVVALGVVPTLERGVERAQPPRDRADARAAVAERDRLGRVWSKAPVQRLGDLRGANVRAEHEREERHRQDPVAVSYTHLTLPTSDLV